MESIIWGYLEERILSIWFPAMPPKNLQQMAILEGDIRFGGKNPQSLFVIVSNITTRFLEHP
jgi:hypothetical protein